MQDVFEGFVKKNTVNSIYSSIILHFLGPQYHPIAQAPTEQQQQQQLPKPALAVHLRE